MGWQQLYKDIVIVEFADDCHTGWDLTSFFPNKKTSKCFSEIYIKKDHNIAWVGNNCIKHTDC